MSALIYACIGAFGEDKVDFNAEVRPIINSKCISCHGGVKQAGGFSMLFREDALGKTKSGKAAIIPGHPNKSEFIKRLTATDPELRMPLGKDPLTFQEIEILKKWISQGANWEDHWAFIKPKAATPPSVADIDFIKNDIDRFVYDKFKEADLKPSPEADKSTLIRRVSLDLTGLPPTEKEVNDFLKDSSSRAYENVVDKLLQSTSYGERWAGMWLDLARYSDTKGYEKDQHRNIWRFRDYLIKSFNEDKPYNKFTIEQLAGDLITNPTEDQIIATAFHRNTMNNDEGGTNDEEFRTVELIDRVNTTFDVWQGITISCVQCHSHPYDPIRHKEYYSFMAFLNNTRDNDLPEEAPTFVSEKDFDEIKAEEIISKINELTKDHSPVPTSYKEKRRKYLLPNVVVKDFVEISKVDFNPPTIRFLEIGGFAAYDSIDFSGIKAVGCNYVSDKGGNVEVRLDRVDGPLLTVLKFSSTFGEFNEVRSDFKKYLMGLHKVYFILLANEKGVGDGRVSNIKFFTTKKKEKKTTIILDSLKNELDKAINPKGTPVFQELSANNRRTTNVFIRGNWTAKGEKVDCAVPKAFNPFPKGAPNNRLGMALWLTSDENPLTARVQVNRLWEQLFGYGIVETLEDFGSQGMKPSHPELLDWLAVKFMKDYKWSTKKILKLIVMSGTYRQSSAASTEHIQKDIRNKYLARGPRVRLTAEQIRDQALSISGLLSTKMYGPSVMPPQPKGVWQTVYSGMEWKEAKGEDKYRRALYTYMRRTSPYPNMITFDAPSREFCMVRRIRTNTPLQALAILNDTVTTEIAVALAKRMMAEGGTDLKSQINTGFKIALAHYPDKKSLNQLISLYYKANGFYSNDTDKAVAMVGSKEKAAEIAPLAIVASAIINQDEFITKE